MTLHEFWALHADALGVAVIAAGLLVLGWWRLDRAHRRRRLAQRANYKAMRAADRRELNARYKALIALLAHRTPTYDEDVTQAIALAGPVRTPLQDASGDLTVDRAGYYPTWTSGEVRW